VFGALGTERAQTLDEGIGVEFVRRRLRGRLAPLEVRGPLLQQPIAQRPRGANVVVVVARDVLEQRRTARLHPLLVFDDRAGAPFDVARAGEAGQLLKILQTVRLGPHAQGVAGHDEEVDEETGLDQFGEQHLVARPTRQALERGSLGVVVVVHVHRGMGPPAGREVLHQPTDHHRLLVEVVGPTRVVAPRRVRVAHQEAGQEEQSVACRPEGMALEVEEQVPVIGRRHQLEAVAVDRVVTPLDQFEVRHALGPRSRGHLQRGLSGQTVQVVVVDVGDRRTPVGQFDDRAHAGALEGLALGNTNVGHVDERIAVAPFALAATGELADLAVGARFRFRGDRGLLLVQEHRQLPTQTAPVGAELFDLERLLLARPEPEVHPPRCGAAEGRYRLGVEAQLQHVSRFGLRTRQLGVDRLVGGEPLFGLDANEEVGDAPDAVVHEGHLVDDVVAPVQHAAHASDPLHEGLVGIATGYLVDGAPGVLQIGETGPLVGRPLLDEQLRQRAQGGRLHREQSGIGLVAQGEEVGALEPRRDLRRGQQPFRHCSAVPVGWSPVDCPLRL
jgi:hypothetical protein